MFYAIMAFNIFLAIANNKQAINFKQNGHYE